MLDIQIVHPTLPVIMVGDFNIVSEDRDSINRNANLNEVNVRRILKDLMYDINLKDCFRQLIPTGGFTWQWNNTTVATNTTPVSTTTIMPRLDDLSNCKPSKHVLKGRGGLDKNRIMLEYKYG